MTTARKLHGDLADDIDLLASDGKVIRRHDGMYRLNGAPEKLTAAMVRGMAAEVRNRRMAARSAAKPDAPRARMSIHEITKTREGTPAGDGAGNLCEGQVGSTVANKCTKCGGPRSKESKGLCAGCYTPKGWLGNPKPEARNPFASSTQNSTALQGPKANAGDGGETAATRCRPSPLNSDAAPSGREDVVVSDAPPVVTPQTASGPGGFAVTPAPESGASAGTHCPCGRPIPHGGRCWHKRGLSGPVVKQLRKRALKQAPTLSAKERLAALERKVAALEALMSMEGLR